MLYRKALSLCPLPLLLCLCMNIAHAQNCALSNLSISYEGSESHTVVHSVITSRNELLSIGNINYIKNNLVTNDGWISLYTANGNVVWSKRYSTAGFDIFQLNDITTAADSTYYITGIIQTYWGVRFPVTPNPNWGILLHVDKYGNLLWAKKMDNGFDTDSETYLQNIITLSNGDLLANAVIWKRPPLQTREMLIRLTKEASPLWATNLSSDVFEFRFNLSNKIKQLSDGSLVTGGIIDQRLVAKDSIIKVDYYLAGFDPSNGNRLWDKTYLIRDKPANSFVPENTIRNITQLPNGDLSFLAFADTNSSSVPPTSTTAINMITGGTGNIKKVIGYKTTRQGSYMVDGMATGSSGSQVMLLYDGSSALLSSINKDGQPDLQKAFKAGAGTEQPVSLLTGTNGYYIFLNNNTGKGKMHLLKTDTNGDNSCEIINEPLTSFSADALIRPDDAQMHYSIQTQPDNIFSPLIVNNDVYPLQMTVNCRTSCCTDLIDSVNIIKAAVCDDKPYILPDNKRVTVTGNYFTNFKTTGGCDSINYYQVTVTKSPLSLTLGSDTCMEGKDSIILSATPGFDAYTWMNTTGVVPFFTVKNPGKYAVTVSNSCGNKTASIQVLPSCDPGLYIPNAFTPNGDHLNDVFRVPPSTKYRLTVFRIYNRYGQVIYDDIKGAGWDGNFKRIQQPNGVYTYTVTIELIASGRSIQASGNVQLIR